METYKSGSTLYIEADEGEDTGAWWLDQTISKVVRHNFSEVTMIAERLEDAPRIVQWVSPATFETQWRMCNTWRITHMYKETCARHTMELPINLIHYTMKDRVRQSM
jgi:hypothetical protein